MSSMSTHGHTWQRLRTVFAVGALLTVAMYPTLLPSASSVAHAAALPSGTPSATQPNGPANPTPGTVYTAANCVQPPNNVDHATFTDAQLITYRMPTRESFPSTAVFAKTVRAMKHQDCQYTVGSAAEEFGNVQVNNPNWAGYDEYAGNWYAVLAEWWLSSIPVCNNSTLRGAASNWGGIGGVNQSPYLVQSGTVAWCDDPNSGNSNAIWYESWVENTFNGNDSRAKFDTVKPTPGDLMESIIGQVGGSCAYRAVNDVTTGRYFSPDESGPCGQQNYFDCMEENDNYGLADNVSVEFSLCEGYDVPQSRWLVMGNPGSTFYDNIMVNQYTDAIPSDQPNSNGSGGFVVTYENHN
jgi:hypothetical protein